MEQLVNINEVNDKNSLLNNIPIYVVNLKEREEVNNRLKESLNYFGVLHKSYFLDAIRFELLPQSEKDFWDKIYSDRSNYLSSPSLVGCLSSHYRIWEKIVDSKNDYALIFEEDVLFKQNFLKEFNNINLPNDFDVLFIGGNFLQEKKLYSENTELAIVDYGVYIPDFNNKQCFTTESYILSKKGAKKLIDYIDIGNVVYEDNLIKETTKSISPVDWYMHNLAKKGVLLYYGLNPLICYQEQFKNIYTRYMIKTYKDLKNYNFESNVEIPKIIFRTSNFKIDDLPQNILDLYQDELNNNPEYTLFYFDDKDCEESILDSNDEELIHAYNHLIPTAYKADLWRYYILYKYGGIYVDFSHKVHKTYDEITCNKKEVFVKDKADNAIYNAFMCSVSKNKLFDKAIKTVCKNVRERIYINNNLEITGPSLLYNCYSQLYSKEFEFEYFHKFVSEKYNFNNPITNIFDKNENIIINCKQQNHNELIYANDESNKYYILHSQNLIYKDERWVSIENLYKKYLLRKPDLRGIITYYKSSQSVNHIEKCISDSDEYKNLLNNIESYNYEEIPSIVSKTSKWLRIEYLYKKLLLRKPKLNEIYRYYISNLDLKEVKNQLYNCEEYLNIPKENKKETLYDYEKKVYSQNNEDGVIEYLLSAIGFKNKYYVEFGVEDGSECNTKYIREEYGFSGLMMDGTYENHEIGLYKEFITPSNINQLFEKYNVPKEFDLLSIDVDFNDFYIWKNISDEYKPNIVIIEYNAEHEPPKSLVVQLDESRMWNFTKYYGASLSAMNHIAEEKGYTLVYCDSEGVNAFFVRNELLHKLNVKIGDINEIYVPYDRHRESEEKMIQYP